MVNDAAQRCLRNTNPPGDDASPAGTSIGTCRAITLHVITKNLQSIRSDVKMHDIIAELDSLEFDVLFITETWRTQLTECMETSGGHKLFLSGGDGHCGVEICVSKSCFKNMSDIVFNAYSPRICSLTFRLFGKHFFMCSCYFLTTWDTDDAVDGVYSLLNTLLETGSMGNKIPLLGGDFNASIGTKQACDDVVSLSQCGMGQRNERGSTLAHWVLEHGLHILNRIRDASFGLDSWTCKRTADNALVQLDYIITLECVLSSQCPRGTTTSFQLAWTIGAFIACSRWWTQFKAFTIEDVA